MRAGGRDQGKEDEMDRTVLVVLFSQSHTPWFSCSPRATRFGFPILPKPHALIVLFSQSHTPWLTYSPRATHFGFPVSKSHTPWLSCSPRATHLGFLFSQSNTPTTHLGSPILPEPHTLCLCGLLLRCVCSVLAVEEAAVRTCVR
jgi:hypothetical protein